MGKSSEVSMLKKQVTKELISSKFVSLKDHKLFTNTYSWVVSAIIQKVDNGNKFV